MGHQRDIWLGDLMRVIRRLKPADNVSRAAMAELLGFKFSAPEKASGSTPFVDNRKKPSPDQKETMGKPEEPSFPPPPVETSSVPSNEKSQALTNVLEPSEESEFKTKKLTNPWKAIKPLEEVTERHLKNTLPYEPLFKRSWSREILAVVAAKQEMGGGVDINQLVQTVTEGTAIASIPQLSGRTLRSGVQLLIDNGLAMEPFRRDQTHLAVMLKAVVGESRVEEVYFSDCPTRGCFDLNGWKTVPYHSPAPGTPVLVLSDLGIGAPPLHRERGSVMEWTKLAVKLNQRDCPLIALVPYPKQRWRVGLTGKIIHIPWDRTTSLSRVLEILI